jgi:hypothetical protein
MKFVTSILLTALFGFALPLFSFMPWWAFAIGSFIVAFVIPQKGWKAFIAGFLGLFLLWGIHALIIDSANEHILSTRIAGVLPLGGNAMLLIFLTAFVGGLVSAFAALTGSISRTVIFPERVVTRTHAQPLEDSVV